LDGTASGAANIPIADARRARLRVDSGRDEQLELDFDQPADASLEDWDLVRDVKPAFPGPARPHPPQLSWD
jgi:hypothetical protein